MSERSPEAIEAAVRAYEGDDQWATFSGTLRGDALEDARRALDAANQVDPVVPVRVLRKWMDAAASFGDELDPDDLAALLDEYDQPNTNGETR